MNFPSTNEFYIPILEYFYSKNKMEKYIKNEKLRNVVIDKLQLNDEQIKLETPKGNNKLDSTIVWTITFLYKSGLLNRPKRGYIIISEEGKKIYKNKIEITTSFLKENYPEFREFMSPSKTCIEDENTLEFEEITNDLYSKVSDYYEYIEELILKKLFKMTEKLTSKDKGDILENISVELFSKMGYFDVKRKGGTNDGGVDGDFSIDRFGLERIAFQCKFFSENNKVASKDIDAFSGSLSKLGYHKGVFITTSDFTKESEYKNITLINGKRLSELMREYEILCNVDNTYKHYSLDD